jgi:hypothetical protein
LSFNLVFGFSTQEYINKAIELKLYDKRYWKLLLHFDNDKSEIENKEFFLSKNGKYSPKDELIATIKGIYNNSKKDDNSTICRFPARTRWLKEKLNLQNLPQQKCYQYNKILERLDPVSATIVFPSAHINSPASMFGHTFIRVNSSYNSKLLSYAINYAANANPDKENGIVFAMKGLFGGYYGRYSLLPYYDKLKEYRDSENRDIWEYDLNLNKEETLRMVEHIWEIKDAQITYLFLTRNCSYEMLWLLEVARPTIRLKEHFTYQVIPFETIYAIRDENLITSSSYRPSQRSKIEAYKSVLNFEEIQIAKKLYKKNPPLKSFFQDKSININKKRYILEVSIELLQYYYQKGDIKKEEYLDRFHTLTTLRAKLGKTKKVTPKEPPNPLHSHRAIRAQIGGGFIDSKESLFVGFRPAYHDMEDSPYGFLRGTQIEFLNFEASINEDRFKVEDFTLVSIQSLPLVDEFFTPITWRLKAGWDNSSLDTQSRFGFNIGAGSSIGNDKFYTYLITDISAYEGDIANFAAGINVGMIIDGFSKTNNTLAQYTLRIYDNKELQNIFKFSQNFRLKQNLALKLKYTYKDRFVNETKFDEQTFACYLHFYF